VLFVRSWLEAVPAMSPGSLLACPLAAATLQAGLRHNK
jgi:hypothetical protein